MDKRIFLGIALWAVIALPLLWLSSKLFPPQVVAKPPVPPPVTQPTDGGNGAVVGPGPGPGPGPAVEPLPDRPVVTREIGNAHFHAVLTSKGGSIQSLELLTYKERYLPRKEHPAGDKPLELIYEAQEGHRTLLLRVIEGEKDPLDQMNWEVKSEPGQYPVVFEWTGPTGLHVTKRFSLSKDSPYALEVEIEVSRAEGGVYRFETEAQAGLAHESDGAVDLFAVVARAERAADRTRLRVGAVESTKHSVRDALKAEKEWDEKKEKEGKNEDFRGVSFPESEYGPGWIGVTNRYFVAALIPMTDSFGKHPVELSAYQSLTDSKERKRLEEWDPHVPGAPADQEKARNERLDTGSRIGLLALYRSPQVDLGKGTWKWNAVLYAGPKTEDDLGAFATYGLDKSLDYGTFGFVSRALLWILGVLNQVFGNWGWSIIVLTVIVRAAIFPLNRKAQMSAHKMSKLQPKMVELKERYAKEKEKLGQEMMKLYRDHGVNPLGGCLPIFLQLPILWGLYQALLNTLDLRQQPFTGWIRDLSQSDMMFEWHFAGIGCCFGQPMMKTEFFNLLPLIMIVTWFVQSLTYPKPQDPQAAQTQKMMMWMPFLFGLMMFSQPSGLILYWMTSTFLGICEQQYIKRVVLPKL